MPTYLMWDDEAHTILTQKYDGVCTLDEFHQIVDDSSKMLATVPHEVDLIIDMTTMSISAGRLLSAVTHVEGKVPPNQRLLLVVCAPAFIRAIVRVATKIAPKATRNLHFLDTLDQAHDIIGRFRQANAAPITQK
ncbi:MAG: hypothetical protein H7Y09_09100 [Chitinophagaceae bacterium]|nr:hypothetical protein [Anaerolineae bacterium]